MEYNWNQNLIQKQMIHLEWTIEENQWHEQAYQSDQNQVLTDMDLFVVTEVILFL
jgi:hypothetical protein